MADKRKRLNIDIGSAEDDMSAGVPLDPKWVKERQEIARRMRNAPVIPAAEWAAAQAAAVPRGQEVGQESRRESSKVYQRGFKKGGVIRGDGCAQRGKTKGRVR